ncbi:MAG: tetratricopeptide repeat protein [Acidobacteriota bacterium]|nr:tetratricopeptide repeat protein [Acidobacteriota bacterium]
MVLITVPGLRVDGLTAERMPQTDALGEVQTLLTPSPSTVPALVAVMGGEDPDRLLALEPDMVRVGPEVQTLAFRLKGAGFGTAAYLGDGDVSPLTGLLRGFDSYLGASWPAAHAAIQDQQDAVGRVRPRRGGLIASRQLVDGFAADLRRRTDHSSFFAWLHFSELSVAAQAEDPRAAWDKALPQIDQAVGDVVSALETYGWADDAVIVVASLHGEALGDGGEVRHGLTLANSVIEIPALFSGGVAGGPAAPLRRLAQLPAEVLRRAGLEVSIPPSLPAVSISLLPRRLYGLAPIALVDTGRGVLEVSHGSRWTPAEGKQPLQGAEALDAAGPTVAARLEAAGVPLVSGEPIAEDLAFLADVRRASDRLAAGQAEQAASILAVVRRGHSEAWALRFLQMEALLAAGESHRTELEALLKEVAADSAGDANARLDRLRLLARATRGRSLVDDALALVESDLRPGQRLLLAQVLEQLEATEPAIEEIEKVLEGDDDAPELEEWRGDLLQGAGNAYRAKEAYERALRSPRAPRASLLAKLGDAYAALGQGDQALQRYAAALEADPDYRYPHSKAAEILLARGEADRAADALVKSLPRTGDEVQDAVTRARVLLARSLVGPALVELTRALEKHPGHPALSRRLAQVYSQSGDKERAIEVLEVSHQTVPRNPGVLFDLLRLTAEVGDATGALRLLDDLQPLAGPELTRSVRGDQALKAAGGELARRAAAFQGARPAPGGGKKGGR